jgi:5-methylthioadenosine/S-adenosylhomocysteine deaminase
VDDPQKNVDLILTNGTVLPLSPGSKPIAQGAVAVSGGRIVHIGNRNEIERTCAAKQTLDAAGGIIMPGLVNTHNHAAMTCYRGIADDLPLMEWLNHYIFPAESKSNGEQVYWSTLLACAEMIRSGTTSFLDMYLFEDRTAEAIKEAGMRALVGEVLYDFPSPNYGPLENGFKFTEDLVERWRDDPLISIAVEPHALYTCSPSLLQRCGEMAQRYGLPLVIHLAESKTEIEEVYKKYRTTPVEHLENLGLLSSSLVASHCVWLTEKDIDLLAGRDVKVAHNPESNMKLGSGVAPIPELLARGITVGLGTDGCASNNNLDLFQEMDSAAKLHKVSRLDPTVMPAETVLHMATLGGAGVLGREKEIGSLEVGKKADIIVLDLNRPHLQPVYNIVSHLVYAVTGADVRDVIIDGKVVMRDRRLLTLDLERILARMTEIREAILKRISD